MCARVSCQVSYLMNLGQIVAEQPQWLGAGPRELSINRPSAVNILHGPASKCHRSTWYDTYGGDDKSPILLVRDLELHKQRKKAWDRGLGPRGKTCVYL